ncbi:MAG: hypothetical protein R3B09_35585 [Nannocystaceae bacterium]
MLLRLVLWTIVLLAALTAVIAGVAIAASEGALAFGVAVAILGLTLSALALARMIHLNRAYQDQHRQAVLDHPSEIIARWTTAKHEVILAERGLFLGRDYLPFNAAYQRLRALSLDAGDERLHLDFDTVADVDPPPVAVPIPAEHRAAVRAFVDHVTGRRSAE